MAVFNVSFVLSLSLYISPTWSLSLHSSLTLYKSFYRVPTVSASFCSSFYNKPADCACKSIVLRSMGNCNLHGFSQIPSKTERETEIQRERERGRGEGEGGRALEGTPLGGRSDSYTRQRPPPSQVLCRIANSRSAALEASATNGLSVSYIYHISYIIYR